MKTALYHSSGKLSAFALFTAVASIAAGLFLSTAKADILYRETFGVPDSNTTDPTATTADWARFNTTGVAITGAAISASASGTGRPTDATQTTSAGPVTDGTFNTYVKGFFYLAATPQPSLGLTTEYSFDPANYTPGSIIFSWYEGNNTANHFFQLMVRIGGTWYANNNTFTTPAIALGSFGSSAVSNALTFDPTASQWKIVNFNGNYTLGGTPGTGTTTDSGLGTVSLGAAPGSDLSGPITGFGFYTFTSGTASGNRRIDTFTIYATPIGGGPPINGTNVWKGNLGGDWDAGTQNWLAPGSISTNFVQNQFSIFDDTATSTNLNLTIPGTNGGILVSNTALNYSWTGSGTLVGLGGLTKKNSGTLTIANSQANSFSGAIDLQAGTIQVGNGNTDVNAGNLGNGAITNNGALLVNIGSGGSVTLGNSISGSGTFTNLGAGTLNLSGSSSFASGLQIQAGTVRANGPGALGAGATFVNTNSILVLGASPTNSFTLASGSLGAAVDFTMATNAELLITSGTTNLLLSSDPQTPTTSRQMLVDGRVRGSGTILIKNADNTTSPDSANGVRFRGTNSVSDFTGTIIVTNNGKTELLVASAGPFSPVNSGKFLLYCGLYNGVNTVNADANTGYMEFNVRNNYTNDTIIGNDLELLGTAGVGVKNAVVLNALGNAPNGAVSTLGNLKIGDTQELIGYKNTAATTNGVKFTTVTLQGGTATFSPHSSDFGPTNQAGAFLILNNVGESVAGSSILMNGLDTLTLTGTSTYTGPTTVQQGKLLLNSLNTAGGVITNVSGTILGGTGTNSGVVQVDGSLAPGNTGSAGTFTASGTLVMNGALVFDIGTNNTIGGGVNDLVVAGNLNLNGGAATVVVNPLTPTPLNLTYRLINYTAKTGTFSGDPASVGRLQFHLDYSVANQVNMTVTGGPAVSRWASTTDGTWDNAGQINWSTNGVTTPNAQFQPTDTAVFDDLVTGAQANISLNTTVVPGWLTNNSSLNSYTISGTGSINGSGGLTKLGNATLNLNTTNNFTGDVVISAGTLRVNNTNALGSWNSGSVTATGGGTLDLGGFTAAVTQANPMFGTKQFFINGAGVGGNGAIVNNSTTAQLAGLEKVTLLGNATIGGPGRWDLRNGTPVMDLAGFKLTKTGSNQISLVATLVTAGDIDINQGCLSFETSSTVTNGGTVTVNTGGSLGFFRLFAGAMTRSIVLNGGSITNTTGNGSTNDSPISITANSFVNINAGSGNDLYLRGPISGSFGLTKLGAQSLIFSGTNTYSGNTIISNGTVILVDGTTSLTNSPTVQLASGGTLDLTQRSNSVPAKTLTVINGQTLNESGAVSGTVIVNSGGVMTGTGGTVSSNVTISAGAFLLPGGTNGIGRINVGLSPTLSGRTVIEIDKSNLATNDQVFAAGPVIYGGTLTVTNIGPALASGDVFKIFNGASYPTFFTLDLANPGVGLSWVTNQLNVSGILSVTSNVAPGPTTNATITKVTVAGTNMIVHGTNNNVPNTSFHYVVLTTANLTNALSNWTPVITNPFNPDGTFDYTNPIVPGTPQQFIDVKAVP